MHISDVSMHRNPELARWGSTERLGLDEATHGEVLWPAEWAFPGATSMTIGNQTPKRGWSFVEYWLALALTKIPENSGNLNSILRYVQV